MDVHIDCLVRIDIGGPETFTQNEIANVAFAALDRPAKITHVPTTPVKALIGLAKFFGLGQSLGALDFFVNVSQIDMAAPPHGNHTLADFFQSLADADAADPARLIAT